MNKKQPNSNNEILIQKLRDVKILHPDTTIEKMIEELNAIENEQPTFSGNEGGDYMFYRGDDGRTHAVRIPPRDDD